MRTTMQKLKNSYTHEDEYLTDYEYYHKLSIKNLKDDTKFYDNQKTIEKCIDLGGLFFDYHNMYTLHLINRRDCDELFYKEFVKKFKNDNEAMVVMDVLEIYKNIIYGHIQGINNVDIRLNNWHKKYKNTHIGKWTVSKNLLYGSDCTNKTRVLIKYFIDRLFMLRPHLRIYQIENTIF